MGKPFAQYCPIAHALSLVGDRWALLVVRELLRGPQRYTDLAGGLPGIGTNVLATRLRDLEAGGIVHKRKLPPPAASTVYELTEYGADLEEVIHAMARWGARTLGLPRREDDLEADWGVYALRALFYPARAEGLTETYVLRVDDDAFTARIVGGRLESAAGAAADPDLELTTDMPTFFALASGDFPAAEAIAEGRLEFDGEAEAVERCFRVFSFAPRMDALAPVPVASLAG